MSEDQGQGLGPRGRDVLAEAKSRLALLAADARRDEGADA